MTRLGVIAFARIHCLEPMDLFYLPIGIVFSMYDTQLVFESLDTTQLNGNVIESD